MNKKAFTLIELIFVIVILGILASVAIPKLAGTRDDAQDTTDCVNLARCLTDMGAEYTATAKMDKTASQACVNVENSSHNTIVVTPNITNGSVVSSGAPQSCNSLNTTSLFGASSVSW